LGTRFGSGDHDRRWLLGHGRHADAFDSKIFNVVGDASRPATAGGSRRSPLHAPQCSGQADLLGYLQEKELEITDYAHDNSNSLKNAARNQAEVSHINFMQRPICIARWHDDCCHCLILEAFFPRSPKYGTSDKL